MRLIAVANSLCSKLPQRLRLLPLLLVAAPMVGCSDGRPSRVPVAGQVLIDGQPLTRGNIRFHAKSHRPASGVIGPGGSFQLSTYEFGDGCVAGTHDVTVTAVEVVNATTERWLAPKKYSNVKSSGITYTVNEPTTSAQINLTWDGGKPFLERIQGKGD